MQHRAIVKMTMVELNTNMTAPKIPQTISMELASNTESTKQEQMINAIYYYVYIIASLINNNIVQYFQETAYYKHAFKASSINNMIIIVKPCNSKDAIIIVTMSTLPFGHAICTYQMNNYMSVMQY